MNHYNNLSRLTPAETHLILNGKKTDPFDLMGFTLGDLMMKDVLDVKKDRELE